MKIKKSQIKSAGIKFIHLADALGVVPSAITAWPDEIADRYQYLLRFGSKEAQAIRRKTLKYIRSTQK